MSALTTPEPVAAFAPVADAASLLQLIWLASPALPVGGFSYSEGLEALIHQAGADTESEASEWLLDQLHLAQSRSDWPVLAQAITAWRAGDVARVKALNEWVLQTRETSELRLQTEQMGKSLTDWLRNQYRDQPECVEQIDALARITPTYPVAYALAVALTQASVQGGVLAFAFGWAENMVQAALKAVPLGQSAGQRVLARLAQDIPDAVTRAIAASDDQRQAFTPLLAVLSAQHETQYSRLFRS